MIFKPVCSIIIRAYNEEAHIRRLLQGITEQTVRDVQVILVDSGSTDGTVAVAQEFEVEVVHISPEEFTFGRSLNLGIAQARADLVVMASAHVYPVYPDWLEQLLAPFKDDEVGLTYGKQRGANNSHFSEQQIFKHWYPEVSSPRQDHPFCNNANAAIRLKLWQEHAYDETLPGLEDLEWGKWVQSQGSCHCLCCRCRGHPCAQRKPEGNTQPLSPRRHGIQKDLSAGEIWSRRSGTSFLPQRDRRLQGCRSSGSDHAKYFAGLYAFAGRSSMEPTSGYRQSGPLTWGLRQAFYYPRVSANELKENKRQVEPIQYSKIKD